MSTRRPSEASEPPYKQSSSVAECVRKMTETTRTAGSPANANLRAANRAEAEITDGQKHKREPQADMVKSGGGKSDKAMREIEQNDSASRTRVHAMAKCKLEVGTGDESMGE